MLLESVSDKWKDYQLIDSGDFEKLERFGPYCLRRPEPKALWSKSLPDVKWEQMADTCFETGAGFGKAGKEDSGTWHRKPKMADQWEIAYRSQEFRNLDFRLRLGLTSFKHVGVFPEQAPNWEFIFRQTSRLMEDNRSMGISDPVKVINLFAYTGAASLAAKCAGADVTHLDSVRQVVSWANGNMVRSGLDNIRWVVEDAMKFVRRQAKRGNIYQGIILDPPAYGHGPDGEKWKLDESLFEMMRNVVSILDPQRGFVLLNLYSNGYSAVLADTIVREAVTGRSFSSLEYGELVLRDSFGKNLPLSVFSRLVI